MDERRYSDGEVRKILEIATRAEASGSRSRGEIDGLTLSEIQGIAREVGVPATAVAQAAAALDSASEIGTRRSWGMPVGVGRVVPLPRPLTDEEWARLVAELRATFRTRGRVVVQGDLREWSRGNLHASVEPAASGYRLRLGTVKGDARPLTLLGVTGVAAGAALAGLTALSGAGADLAAPLVFALSGGGAVLANLVRLPRWADQRRRQMESIEAKVRRIVASSPEYQEQG